MKQPTTSSVTSRTALACSSLLIGMVMHAQTTQLSLGADVMLPLGDFSEQASLGVGPALGVEFPVGTKAGLVVQLAYDFITPKDDSSIDSWTMLPLQAGGKFYFKENQDGFYGSLLVGMHNQTVTTKEIDLGPILGTLPSTTESEAYFSWGLGLGYQLAKFDFGARYNGITGKSGGSNWGYIGFRAAYLLNLGS